MSRGHWLAGAALTAVASGAAAQAPTPPAPVEEVVDGNGVSLFRGEFAARQPVVTIGGSQGLSFDRIYRGPVISTSLYGALDKFASIYLVTFAGQTDKFTLDRGTYVPSKQLGQSLTLSGSTYTYTTRDGTVVIFNKAYANQFSSGNTNGNEGRITSVTSPSGSKITYSYEQAYYETCTGGGGRDDGWDSGGTLPQKPIDPKRAAAPLNKSSGGDEVDPNPPLTDGGDGGTTDVVTCSTKTVARLATVTNAYGYQLVFSYLSGDPNGSGGIDDWWKLTKVEAKNLSVCNTGPCNGPSTLSPNVAANTFVSDTTSDPSSGSYHKVTAWRRFGESVDAGRITYASSGAWKGRVAYYADTQEWANGKRTSYTYSDSATERTVTVTNATLDATSYVFDLATERLTKIIAPLGRQTTFEYDPGTGQLAKTTYPEGNYEQRFYDTRGNLVKLQRWSKADGSGNRSSLEKTWTYLTDCLNVKTCNQPTWITSETGAGDRYYYNDDGTLDKVQPWNFNGSGNPAPEIRYTYVQLQAKILNASNQLVANGLPVTLLYTTSQCRTGAAPTCLGGDDETVTETNYAVNENLLPTSVTVRSGNSALSTAAGTSYDTVGNVVSVNGPLTGAQDTTTYKYDQYRRQVGVISPDPDGAGALKPRAQRTNYGSGALPLSVEVGSVNSGSDSDWAAFAPRAKVAYDYSNGLVIGATSSVGGRTFSVQHTQYDNASHVTCVTQRLNPAEWATLTPACTLQTDGPDGRDRVTKYTYDDAERVTSVASAFSSSSQADVAYTYTQSDQIDTVTDDRGNKTWYSYDGFLRPVRTTYPQPGNGGLQSATDYEENVYTGAKLTSQRLRDSRTVSYNVNNAGMVKTKTLPSNEGTVSYGRDLQGHITSVQLGAVTQSSIGYDALGRVTSEGQMFGSMSYGYDQAGRRTSVTWGDGFEIDYSYLVTGEVKTVTQAVPVGQPAPSPIAAYAYDDRGRRVSLTRGDNRITTTYGYGDAGGDTPYLTSLSHVFTVATASNVTNIFTYNAAGEIKASGRTNDTYAWNERVGINRPYTANALNQLTTAGSTSLLYEDGRGNLTKSGTDTYAYTSQNELKSRNNGTTLSYDSLGRLSTYAVAAGSTRFLYDGGQIAAKLDDAGTSSPVRERYVWGAGADELLAVVDASATRSYAVQDERGSVIAYATGNGVPTTVNRYDEYGYAGAGNAGPFGYTGQLWLPELNLYSYKARMYSPSLGRFMQTDPTGYADGVNWYNYVGGNPLNRTDPSGTLSDQMYANLCKTSCTGASWNTFWSHVRAEAIREILKADRDGNGAIDNADSSALASALTELGLNGDYIVDAASITTLMSGGLFLGEHDYIAGPNLICPASWGCSGSLVANTYSQVRNGIPGNTSSDIIVSGKTYPAILLGIPIGTVQSYVGVDGLTVVNRTNWSHLNADGWVNRNAYLTRGGDWYSISHGSGTNYYGGVFNAALNQFFGPGAFDSLDRSIKAQLYTATHH